ncbi:hypothetical protein G7046_g9915 [Stylonectria norvegica]|nr:hypothetical protein G7046_g9915 [Stylonectria norvegica]
MRLAFSAPLANSEATLDGWMLTKYPILLPGLALSIFLGSFGASCCSLFSKLGHQPAEDPGTTKTAHTAWRWSAAWQTYTHVSANSNDLRDHLRGRNGLRASPGIKQALQIIAARARARCRASGARGNSRELGGGPGRMRSLEAAIADADGQGPGAGRALIERGAPPETSRHLRSTESQSGRFRVSRDFQDFQVSQLSSSQAGRGPRPLRWDDVEPARVVLGREGCWGWQFRCY